VALATRWRAAQQSLHTTPPQLKEAEMYGISTRTRAYGRTASVAAITLILAAIASPARAQVGNHGPAAVNCSASQGKIQTFPMYEKIGPMQTGSVPQLVAHLYYFQNKDTGAWYKTTWSDSYYLAPNASFNSAALGATWSLRGRYHVYTMYAWNLLNGAGWSYATDRTQEYSSFEYAFTDTYCHAQTEYTIVAGNANSCSDFTLCASTSSKQRVTRIRGKLHRWRPNLRPTRAPSEAPVLPPAAGRSRH
jgi:hypothetical protein